MDSRSGCDGHFDSACSSGGSRVMAVVMIVTVMVIVIIRVSVVSVVSVCCK